MKSAALEKTVRKEVDNWISKKHQKHRGCAPGGFITILNKLEWGTLYQTTYDS